jgi:hypothetical protein
VLPDSTGAAAQPRVAMGLNGTVAVAFVRQGVRVAVRRDGGRIAPRIVANALAPRTVSSVPASRPRMVAAVDGAVVVAWREAPLESAAVPASHGPLAAAVRSRAGRFSAARTISTTPIFEPELAAGLSGDVLLAWSTPRGVEPSLPGWDSVRWALRGRGTSDVGDAAVADGSPSFAPTGRLGFLADGSALLAVGGPGGVRVVKRPPGGAFATTQLVARAGDLPQLVTRRGHAAVVFATGSRLGEAQLRISVRG